MFTVLYVQAPGESGVRVKSTEELEAVWGDRIRHLGQEHPTAYLLCQALAKLDTPVRVSDAIARKWLRHYCGITVRTRIDNAGHLELDWGARIREHLAGAVLQPAGLPNWMLTSHGVSVSARVCQAWLARDWASSGALMVPGAVETTLGDKLRLDEYKQYFVDEADFTGIVSVVS